MSLAESALQRNPIYRYLHLHCLVHMYRVLASSNPSDYFRKPPLKLFTKIQQQFNDDQQHSLFKNLLYTYRNHILIGTLITIIFTSLNLFVPQLIRQFMHFMRVKDLDRQSYGGFLSKFILVQIMRIFFSQHSKRLFHELAIKIESTLAKKLISKSLKIAKHIRNQLPNSQIIQLQNVDLKLIFNLFRNMHLIIEAPITIIVSIILLFNQSLSYGFIGFYWFLISFFVQRQLDGRMAHCNQTKLSLIEKRSNINYELFQKIKQAKLIGWEDIITEKNNQLFIEENHDHRQYYFYSTLYDISLLMLPIFVVASITIYDTNQDDPITVQQVYLMLSLLGICYNPMKAFRTITINFHDGLHSLSRFSKYFHLQETQPSSLLNLNSVPLGQIHIVKDTIAAFLSSTFRYQIKVNEEIYIRRGQRLNVLGKQKAGSTSFLEMIVGNLQKVQGQIGINGKIFYLPQKMFFLKESVLDNIRFLNQSVTEQQIESIYNHLGLKRDFMLNGQMKAMIDDPSHFSIATLKKISLARAFCVEADYYILDDPFSEIDNKTAQAVETKLRQMENDGKTIILSIKAIQYIQRDDHLLILDNGQSKIYGKYCRLANTHKQEVESYFKYKEDIDLLLTPLHGKNIINTPRAREGSQSTQSLRKRGQSKYFNSLVPLIKRGIKLRAQTKKQKVASGDIFQNELLKFLNSVPLSQICFIFLIILSAQILHIFIHFYIGHLEEDYANENFAKFKKLMIVEVILTFCLSGIIFLEGEFISVLAAIIGNKVYKGSLQSVTSKRLSWYSKQYNVKLADKYNHDYEDIYIVCHNIFGIYKNIVILIATVEFISTNRSKLVAIFIVLAAIYYTIFYVFRKIQRKIVEHYYDYKYNYVRVFQQSIEGAQMLNICGLREQVLKRAEDKYISLASYKLSQSYTTYGLSLFCDILSVSLLAIGIEYGIQMKVDKNDQKISIIATSIYLLMNISQVLKTIIREMLNLQSFFSINVIPFMEIIKTHHHEINQQPQTQKSGNFNGILSLYSQNSKSQIQSKSVSTSLIDNLYFKGHQIQFHKVLLAEPGESFTHQNQLTLTIKQGEVVLLYQKEARSRQALLFALTKNLAMFNQHEHFGKRLSYLVIGGVDIRDTSRKYWHSNIGVFSEKNFYFNGTIKQNISWGVEKFDNKLAIRYAKLLKIQKHFLGFTGNILQIELNSQQKKISNEIIKKIAILRILVKKPKIVILNQIVDEYIDSIYLIELFQRQIRKVTIIKISHKIEASKDCNRIVSMQGLKILQDGNRQQLIQNPYSRVGQQMSNIHPGYEIRKRQNLKPMHLEVPTINDQRH